MRPFFAREQEGRARDTVVVDTRGSLDFNDQLPVHTNVRAKPVVERDAFITGFPHARSSLSLHLDGQFDVSLDCLA
jgi:hypothetical protein